MTVKHLFPQERPALNLDFANVKRLDRRITFTRASIATYVGSDGLIKTAPDNEARFDFDPMTGESLGLLIEESRTNHTPDGTGFTKTTGAGRTEPSRGTFSSTSVVNPTGSTGTTLFTTDVVSGTYIQIGGDDYSAGAVGNAMSMFIKPNGITKIFLTTYSSAGNQGAYFDLTGDGSVAGIENSLPADKCFIHAYPNGWYRLGVRSSAGATVAYSCAVWEYDGSSNPQWTSVTGDGTSGFYIWGWQNELGAPQSWTSVIPTSGSAVTRAADVASMTGTNFSSWYTPLENTMSIDFSTIDISAKTKPGLVIYDSTKPANAKGTVEGSRAFYYVGTTNYIQVTTRTPQSVRRTFATEPNYNALGQINKVAQAYAGSTDKGCAINGADPSFTASASLNPGNVDSMSIGKDEASSIWLNGHISRIAYYDKRLSNENLQALTL